MNISPSPIITLSNVLSILRQRTDIPDESRDCLFTVDGKTALYAAIRLLSLKVPGKTWLFPAYCCQSVLQTIKDAKVRYELYPIENNLQPTLTYLSERLSKSDDVAGLVLIHYFGFKSDVGPLKDLIRRHRIAIVEDCAHIPMPDNLLKKRDKDKDIKAQIYSLHKWYPIPHGGALVVSEWDDAGDKYRYVTDFSLYKQLLKLTAYELERLLGFGVRGKLLSSSRLAEYIEGRASRENRYDLLMHPKVYSYYKQKMPPLELVWSRQRNNYQYLVNRFRWQSHFSILKSTIELSECPFIFPLIVPEIARERVYKSCLIKGIALRIYWEYLPKEIVQNSLYQTSQKLSKTILCLPIHYGLNEAQLEKMSDIILSL